MTDREDLDRLRETAADRLRVHDAVRRTRPGALRNFEHVQDLELTYTSNAIEGNTLTAVESTMVIEHGITIGGKPLRDHLEAVDGFHALGYVRELGSQTTLLTQSDIRTLHRLVMLRSAPEMAGRYADQGRYVLTDAGRHTFPSPVKVPALMAELEDALQVMAATPEAAFAAHRQLVAIHPFNDGNGRTARLLMNLLLIRCGAPPVAVRPIDRPSYIAALQRAQGPWHDAISFDKLMYTRLIETLDDYLAAAREAGLGH